MLTKYEKLRVKEYLAKFWLHGIIQSDKVFNLKRFKIKIDMKEIVPLRKWNSRNDDIKQTNKNDRD